MRLTRMYTVCAAGAYLFVVSVAGSNQAPVVQRVDNAIHRLNRYPVDSVVCFVNTYPLDRDLSSG